MSHLKNLVKAKERMNPLREYRANLMEHKAKILERIAQGIQSQGAPKKDEALEDIFKLVREIK